MECGEKKEAHLPGISKQPIQRAAADPGEDSGDAGGDGDDGHDGGGDAGEGEGDHEVVMRVVMVMRGEHL